MADLLDQLPEDLQNGPEAQLLRSVGDHKVYNIVHLIYRRAPACRSTGVPAITIPFAPYAIRK
jgi:hypothetical protein